MKMNILSGKEPLQRNINDKDQTAKAIKALNSETNKEYLLKTTQLASDGKFTFNGSKKDELNLLISDPDAPVSARQAAHYLVYKASSFNQVDSNSDVFSFE